MQGLGSARCIPLRHGAPGLQLAAQPGTRLGVRRPLPVPQCEVALSGAESPGSPGSRPHQGADMPFDQSISAFLQSFPGEVLQPTDPQFATARAEAIWNGAITRQPS